MEDDAYRQYVDQSDNWLMRGRTRLLTRLLDRHAPSGRPLELLDVGAGAGQNLPALAPWGHVDAVEINPLGRESIQEHHDVRRLFDQPVPFPLPQTYDIVTAFDVVEHLEHDDEAVRWVADALSPGGLFICTVPAYQWMFGPHDVALGHYRRYTARRLARVLGADLDVRSTGYFNTTLFPLAVGSRLVWSRLRRSAAETGHKQSSRLPAVADRLFAGVLAAEAGLVGRGVRLPYGLSVVVVAAKR